MLFSGKSAQKLLKIFTNFSSRRSGFTQQHTETATWYQCLFIGSSSWHRPQRDLRKADGEICKLESCKKCCCCAIFRKKFIRSIILETPIIKLAAVRECSRQSPLWNVLCRIQLARYLQQLVLGDRVALLVAAHESYERGIRDWRRWEIHEKLHRRINVGRCSSQS